MRAVISGGRTGGHLIPGISMYREIRRRNIGCLYVMSSFDLNFPVAEIVEKADRYLLPLKNMSRKLSLKTPVYIFKILAAFFNVFWHIKKFKPDFILITGGYISNPVALSALVLGKPLYIIEQNSVAGVTNRFYAPFSRKIFTSFPVTGKIPRKKTVFTGNPSLFHKTISSEEAKKFFDLTGFKHIVGITSGSQGSRAINECVISILPDLLKNNIGVIWSAGSVEYKKLDTEGLSALYPNLRIYRFIERMDAFFCASDCIITRAGASSISEIINYKKPSILIPIKNSPDNHQALNAFYLTSNNCGIAIDEDELSPESLRENLLKMLENLPYYIEKTGRICRERPQIPENVIADNIIADFEALQKSS
jgi:UDP-N-acetylglucosamine--N-acetylmuramyl-(pentapeptide) pyrophosphoryl-undecaprenol N-acetylglucosamine transferase